METIKTMRGALVMMLLGVALLALAGCSKRFEVESDTAWTGVIYTTGHAQAVSGAGNSTFSAEDGALAHFRKRTDFGFIRARYARTGPTGFETRWSYTLDSAATVTAEAPR